MSYNKEELINLIYNLNYCNIDINADDKTEFFKVVIQLSNSVVLDPKDKTEITHIDYEPWHYRYVGIEAAKVIFEKNLCLEEYIDTLN